MAETRALLPLPARHVFCSFQLAVSASHYHGNRLANGHYSLTLLCYYLSWCRHVYGGICGHMALPLTIDSCGARLSKRSRRGVGSFSLTSCVAGNERLDPKLRKMLRQNNATSGTEGCPSQLSVHKFPILEFSLSLVVVVQRHQRRERHDLDNLGLAAPAASATTDLARRPRPRRRCTKCGRRCRTHAKEC